MAWICAQALIVKMDKLAGAYAHTKSFSIAGNIGTFIGPLLLGLLWDISGPVGSFLTLATWGMLLFLLSFTLPIDNVEVTNAQQPGLIKSLLPAWTDYRKAFSMLFIPAVFLVMYATCIRLSSTSIRGSFYLVYLQELDFSATKISLLFSSISLVSIFSPLFIRFFSRYTNHYRLLFWSAVMTILPLCLVTLFHQFWPILTISAISGFGLGLTLPLMLSIASKSVDRQDQGLAAGLREMVNRFSAATLPFSFGLFAQSLGLHYAFFVIGLLMIVPMLIIIPFILKRIEAEEHQSSRMAHGVLNK
jgi:Na+/melibiose symporter-like transporter